MDSRTQLLAVVGALLLGLTHALDKNTPAFPELADKWRLLIAAIVGSASAVVDSMVNGTALVPAIVTAFAVSGPALVVLVVTAFANNIAGKGGGTGSIDLSKSEGKRPLPSFNPPAAMVGISVMFVLLAIGCATAKAVTCPIIKVADELCPMVMVQLPDGTQEAVPREEIIKAAAAHKAARLKATQ